MAVGAVGGWRRGAVAGLGLVLVGAVGYLGVYLPFLSPASAARRGAVEERRAADADAEASARLGLAPRQQELAAGSTWRNIAKVRDAARAAGGDGSDGGGGGGGGGGASAIVGGERPR